MDGNSERRPLLSSSNQSCLFVFDCCFSVIHFHFFFLIAGQIIPDIIPVPPIRPEDLPQNIGTNNLLACLVCGSMIDITVKKDQHVVKCDNCNEATVSYFFDICYCFFKYF